MKKIQKNQAVSLLIMCVSMAGCASLDSSQEHLTPKLPIPSEWAAEVGVTAPDTQWIAELGDAQLHALIDEALANNFNLQASAARMRSALASANVQGASRLPTLNGTVDGNRSKTNTNGTETYSNRFSIGLASSWEIDLWQRLNHRTRSAVATAEARRADYEAAQLSLAANIAKSWFSLIETRLQTELSQRRVNSFKATLDVINDRYLSGIGDALDVRLARENHASARSTLLIQQRSLATAQRTLETLLGRYPSGQLENTGTLASISAPIPDSQPLQLLERRPDLRAAKATLISASENQIDARRNMLPSLTLTASGGHSTDEFKNLLDWDNLFWNLAAGLTQPLFQGGKLKAQREIANAQLDEALANYTQTALDAFREVETALAVDPLLVNQLQAQKTAADEAREGAELALERYQAGITGIVTLLESQRRAFSAESNLLSTQLTLITNRIDLHLALGGNFSRSKAQEPSS